MGMLKWFNRDRYSGLSEVLGAIKKELEALQPQDSSDIVWNRGRNGLSAKLRTNASGSEVQADEADDATPSTKVAIAVAVETPTDGFGAGKVKTVVFNTDGSYTISEDSEEIPVIFPYI